MKKIQNCCFLFLVFFLLITGISIADFTINPEYFTGDAITIQGITNFNTDNSVLIEVWPASFGPKGKYESSMTGGGSLVVPVIQGNDSSYTWNATFNSAEWGPDSYMVRAEIIGKNYAETRTFTLVEAVPVDMGSPSPKVMNTSEKGKAVSPDITLEPEPVQTEENGTPEPVESVPTQKSPINFFFIGITLLTFMVVYVIVRVRR